MRRRNPEDYLFPGGTLIAYHGGHLLTGGKFDLSHVGRGEGSSFPGIFFTNSKDNAEGYAKNAPLGENYVYTVRLDARGFYDDQPQRLTDRLAQLRKDIGADKLPTMYGITNRYGYGYIGDIIRKLGPVEGPKALIDIGVTGQVRYWSRATKVGNISSNDLFEVAVLDPSVITILSVEKVSVPYSLYDLRKGRKSEMHTHPYDPLFDKGPPPLSPMAQALHSMVSQIEELGFRVPAHAKDSPEGFVAWAETVNVPPGKRREDVPEYLRLRDEAEAGYERGDGTYSRLTDQAVALALREGIYDKPVIENALRIRREMIASLIRRKEPREIPVFRNPRKRAPATRARRNPPTYREHMRLSAPSSDAFQRWFGKSKVKDETGRPVVVYHGTLNGGFTIFDPAKMGENQAGFYFTPRFDGAASYAEPPIFSLTPVEAAPYPTDANGEARIPDPVQGNKRGVYRVYLKIENPFIYEGRGRQWDALFVPEFPEARRTYEVVALARAAGHDGVIFKEIVDPGSEFREAMDVYVVFDSRNIKSATANDGGYRPDDPDIRHNPMVAGLSNMRPYDHDTYLGDEDLRELVEREIPALAWHHWGGGGYAQVWRIPNSNLVFKATRDESEIAAQARLIRKGFSHPSIVDAYCVAESAHPKDVWFIVTRFVDFNRLPSDYWVWLRDNWEYLQDAAEDPGIDNYPYEGNARGRAQQSRFQRWTDHLFDALRLLALEGIKWLDVSKDNLVLDPTTDLPVILDLGHSEVDGEPEEVPTMTPMEAYRCALRVAGRKANPYRSRRR